MTGPEGPILRTEEQFTIIPRWVACHPDLTPNDVRLYAVLGTFADPNGVAFPGRTLLARLCVMSDRSVDGSAERLEAVGALQRRKRWVYPGGAICYDAAEAARRRLAQSSNEYVLRYTRTAQAPSNVVQGGANDVRSNKNHSRASGRTTFKGASETQDQAQARMAGKGSIDPRARWDEDAQQWLIPQETKQ